MVIEITNSVLSGTATILSYYQAKGTKQKAASNEPKQDTFVHAFTTSSPSEEDLTAEITRIQKKESIDLAPPDISGLAKSTKEDVVSYEGSLKRYKEQGGDPIDLRNVELKLESKKKFLAILEKYNKPSLSLSALGGVLHIEHIRETLKLDALERQKLALEHSNDKGSKEKLAKLYEEMLVSKQLINDLTLVGNKITRYKYNKDLLCIRAYTNLTNSNEAMKVNTPYYQSIAGNPQAVRTYNELLAKILAKADLKFSNGSINAGLYGLGDDLDSLTSVDTSGKYMIADHLISLAENNPAYLDKLLNYKGGLKARVVPQMSSQSDTGTWYDSTQNMLMFSYESVYRTGVQSPPNLKLFLSDNLDSLDDYLPYRKSLMDDRGKLQEHDKLIEELKKSLNIKFIAGKANISLVGDVDYKKEHETELDDTNKWIMAAVIAEYGSNRELLDNALKARGGLKVRFVKGYEGAMGSKAAGVYDDDDHELFVTIGLDYSFNFSQKLHELAHALDGADSRSFPSERIKNPHEKEEKDGTIGSIVTLFRMTSMVDGFISGSGPDNLDAFKNVRQRLYSRYYDYYGKVGKFTARIELERHPHEVIPGVGLSHYSFRTEEEFLATTVELFYQKPAAFLANKDTLDLYKVYAELFKYDPLNQLATENSQPKKKAA